MTYQRCMRCVMDTTDPDIVFDDKGICNHCHSFAKRLKKEYLGPAEGWTKLSELFFTIGRKTAKEAYTHLQGFSGGVDSSVMLVLTSRVELKPYVITVDNGWDTPEAKHNTKVLTDKFGYELHTVKIDREQYRNLQLAYLLAGVVDIEAITDNIIAAVIFQTAAKKRIKTIFQGANFTTEALMPQSWSWDKLDTRNVKAINRIFGTGSIDKLPLLSKLKKKYYYKRFKRITEVYPLNYIDYNRAEWIKTLKKHGFKEYGLKHYESRWTRLYQGYILPRKFGIDKRIGHFSTLINSDQMTREEAILELQKPPMSAEAVELELEFVCQKLEISRQDFENIMNGLIRKHEEFPSIQRMNRIIHAARRLMMS